MQATPNLARHSKENRIIDQKNNCIRDQIPKQNLE